MYVLWVRSSFTLNIYLRKAVLRGGDGAKVRPRTFEDCIMHGVNTDPPPYSDDLSK